MGNLDSNELYHHGILGMKWGVRRYQNPDGTLTEAGKKRYASDLKDTFNKSRNSLDPFNEYKKAVQSHEKLKEIADSQELKRLYDETKKADYEWSNYEKDNKNGYYSRMAAEVNIKLDGITDKDTKKWYRYGYVHEDLDQGSYNSFQCYLISKGVDPVSYDKGLRTAEDNYRNTLKTNVENLLGEYGKQPVREGSGITPNYVAKTGIRDLIEEDNKSKTYGRQYSYMNEKDVSQLNDVQQYIKDYRRGGFFRHSDTDDKDEDHLEHHGILGMKWGVRRFQNEDGSLTTAGRSRYGSGKKKVGILEAHRIKKRKAEAAKKRAETLAKKKAEEETAQKHEAEKQEAIRSGNATQIAKFQNELSNQELRDALDRLNSKQRLSDLVEKETPKKETKLDKAMKIADKSAKYADIAEKGIKVYNTFAKVSNAFADDDSQLPIIGEKREKKEAKEAKDPKKEAAIRSGDPEQLKKWQGKLTPEEVKTAKLTVDYWNSINDKTVSNTKKEQESGKKAAHSVLDQITDSSNSQYDPNEHQNTLWRNNFNPIEDRRNERAAQDKRIEELIKKYSK